MDAKEKAFRDAAKAEGYSDEDINAHLAKSFAKPQTVEAPTPVAEGPSPGFGANVEAKATQERQRLAADKKIREDAFAIPDWMLPAAAAGLGGAALAGGKAVYKSLSDKMADAPPVRTEPVFGDVPARVPGEPTLDVQALAPQPAAAPAQPAPVPKPTIADLQQKLGITAVPGAAAPAAPVIAAVPPAPVALPATPVAQISAANRAIPANDAAITNDLLATPEAKAEARVNAPENSNVKPFNIVKDSPKVTFGDLVASDEEILKNRQELRNTVSNLQEIRSPDNGKTFYVVDHNGEWGTKAFASEAEAQQELTKIQNKIKNPIPPPEVTPGAAAILETQTPAVTAVTAKQEKKIKGAVAPTGPIETVKTGSGLDAFLGQGAAKERIPSAFKTVAEIPAGYAFVPGMDVGGMNTARNRLGQEGYTEFVKAKGVPFGTYDETQKVLKSLDENRIGPTLTREQRKVIGAPMLPTTTGLGGKAIKVGGVAGALLAISDLASAQSLPEAGIKAIGIGSDFLPVPLQAAMFSNELNANETEQLAYLRRMEQAKARGAGNRGMAYDPRKPYNPQFMDVGIPPPFNR